MTSDDRTTGHILDRLRGAISGTVLIDGDPGFDAARRVWNGMIDRRPSVIVRAASTTDIAPTVAAARDLGSALAIRGGGHNVAGNGTADDAVVLDLGALTAVRVDPERRQVTVEPGATLADVDQATESHGLAVPLGVVSGTGVAGLTLGGGVGWQTRAYGLTADNLVAADVVTAGGATIRASDDDAAELLWGLRGGGGNFGVVSSFTFRAYPLGPEVIAGNLIYRQEHWADALRAFATWTSGLPDHMTSITTTLVPPPAFELGDDPLMLVGYASTAPDRAAVEAHIAKLRAASAPDIEVDDPVRWVDWQSQADLLFPKGVRAYWKNTSFDTFDDAAMDVIIRRGTEQTWRGTAFDIHHMGGAFGRVAENATPFPNRVANYWLNIYGFWSDPAEDAARIAFVRGFADDMAPHASGGTYVNFLGQESDQPQGPRAAALAVYGPAKLARLEALKTRLDPDNMFRFNHNVPPTRGG
jgi:FAD/FMN-containing dehydrogenase